VISLDDVGVDQIGDEFGLTDEVVDELLLIGVILSNDFDGDPFDEFASAVLFGLVDDPHSAFKNFSDNIVPKFVLNGEKRHGIMFVVCSFKSSLSFCRPAERPDFY